MIDRVVRRKVAGCRRGRLEKRKWLQGVRDTGFKEYVSEDRRGRGRMRRRAKEKRHCSAVTSLMLNPVRPLKANHKIEG